MSWSSRYFITLGQDLAKSFHDAFHLQASRKANTALGNQSTILSPLDLVAFVIAKKNHGEKQSENKWIDYQLMW
jgi:hypothetical protein